MIYTLFTIVIIYFFFTMSMALIWWWFPAYQSVETMLPTKKITLIIPVRNEEQTLPLLLDDLSRQTYPAGLLEVIIADDASSDRTRAVAESFILQMPYRLRVLSLSDERTASPKKRAIRESIAQATGDLIITTDGDCRVGPRWIEAIAAFQARTGAKLISGPVTFVQEKNAFDWLQTVEGSSLIGSGACTMRLGIPTMCNGANLVYEKAAFHEVGGFDGVDHVASGDDELLMHKIAARYPGQIHFLKSADAIVQTTPQPSLTAFYHQRKRWASKWRAYQSYLPSLLAVFVFLANAAVPAVLLAWMGSYLSNLEAVVLLLLKAVPEWLFLGSVLLFLRKKNAWPWILLTQLLYPFYVVFFGLAAQRKGFRWKDRELT